MSTSKKGPNAIGSGLGLLGDEWNLLIVRAAMTGPQRYTALQRDLGIAPSVLAARLATLTAADVLRKVADGGRFSYALTRSGEQLWSLLLCIWAWEQRWVQGEALPTMRHLTCGQVFVPVLTCRGCDQPALSSQVHVELSPTGELARAVPAGSNRRRGGGNRASGPGLFGETMALMGSRWSSALLGTAFLGARRFRDFEASLAAPPNIVAERLRLFVSLGVLDPDYELTAKGQDFFPTIAMIVAWGERWFPAPDGPTLLARHLPCGLPFRPALHCTACTGRLHRSTVLVEAPPQTATLESTA